MSETVAITATLLSLWTQPTETPSIYGDAAFYSPHTMRQVCDYRGLDLSGYDGAVALMSCGDLGRTVWIWDEKFLVCDCSRWDHFAMNLERGRAVDIDWETWERHGLPMDLVPVTVSFVPPVQGRERVAIQ